jgi:hypothetical protein
MIRNYFCLLLLLCLMLSCNVRQSSSEGEDASEKLLLSGNKNLLSGSEEALFFTDSIRYAAGFEVTNHEGFVKIEVHDPWNKGQLLQRYLLVPRDKPVPAGIA